MNIGNPNFLHKSWILSFTFSKSHITLNKKFQRVGTGLEIAFPKVATSVLRFFGAWTMRHILLHLAITESWTFFSLAFAFKCNCLLRSVVTTRFNVWTEQLMWKGSCRGTTASGKAKLSPWSTLSISMAFLSLAELGSSSASTSSDTPSERKKEQVYYWL